MELHKTTHNTSDNLHSYTPDTAKKLVNVQYLSTGFCSQTKNLPQSNSIRTVATKHNTADTDRRGSGMHSRIQLESSHMPTYYTGVFTTDTHRQFSTALMNVTHSVFLWRNTVNQLDAPSGWFCHGRGGYIGLHSVQKKHPLLFS